MKVKRNKIQDLPKLGFKKIVSYKYDPIWNVLDTNTTEENKKHILLSRQFNAKNIVVMPVDDTYPYLNSFSYNLGSSRRGQSYYLIIQGKSGNVQLLATKADGDGKEILLDNIFIRLINEGFIE